MTYIQFIESHGTHARIEWGKLYAESIYTRDGETICEWEQVSDLTGSAGVIWREIKVWLGY